MVTIKRERQIFLLRISPSVYPKKAPPESLDNILKILKDIYDEKRALFYVRDGANLTGAAGDESSDALQEKSNDERNAIYIANMEISQDRAVMLINRGDPNLADPAYINSATRQIRVAEHSEDESLGYSAHIVIDLRHDKMIAGSYRCALEKMPNISRALVVNFINKLLLRYAKDAGMYTYINKKKESVSYRPRISIMTLASSSLREDLVKGYVSSVELVNNSAAFQGLDQGNRIIKAQSRLMLKIGSENNGNPFLAWLKEITHKAREGGWDQIQVNIRGLPSGRSASPTFETVVEDAADVLYAQSEIIDGFGADLQQCYAEICPEVVSRVWLLVGDDRVWVKV